jgi:hypothetical protein
VENQPPQQVDPFGLETYEQCISRAGKDFEACNERGRKAFEESKQKQCGNMTGHAYYFCVQRRLKFLDDFLATCRDRLAADRLSCLACPSGKPDFIFGPEGGLYESI